jgi:hypothetical protein
LLTGIIGSFSKEIRESAVDLVQHMGDCFVNYMRKDMEQVDGDIEKYNSHLPHLANGALRSISVLAGSAH